MVKLKAKGLKWLKGFHLVAVSCWVGGGVALILLYFLKNGVTDGNVLYGINQSIHYVDIAVVVIPGALGCLITGLIYSSFSNFTIPFLTYLYEHDGIHQDILARDLQFDKSSAARAVASLEKHGYLQKL